MNSVKPTVLVTGGTGQLAYDLIQQAIIDNQVQVIACSHQQLDITNPQAIKAVFERYQPDMVINTAAYTAVDKAEQEADIAYQINHRGAALMAEACAASNIPLLQVSTDYVFDGQQQQPYREEDAPSPLNVYGLSKWQGEQAIQEKNGKAIILRVSALFGVQGQNFVKTIVRLATEREQLRVVADQITCPTSTASIATAILKITSQVVFEQQFSNWGIYHYCSREPISWYGFAEQVIAEAAKYQPLRLKQLTAIPSVEYPTPAKRPAFSVMATDKILTQFGLHPPSWRSDLQALMAKLTINQ